VTKISELVASIVMLNCWGPARHYVPWRQWKAQGPIRVQPATLIRHCHYPIYSQSATTTLAKSGPFDQMQVVSYSDTPLLTDMVVPTRRCRRISGGHIALDSKSTKRVTHKIEMYHFACPDASQALSGLGGIHPIRTMGGEDDGRCRV
jgi:hypothetical protein